MRKGNTWLFSPCTGILNNRNKRKCNLNRLATQALADKVVDVKAPLALIALEGHSPWGSDNSGGSHTPMLNPKSSVSLNLPPPVTTTDDRV